MAALTCRGSDLGYTILPFQLDTVIQNELIAHPSDFVLGYITYNQENGRRKFTYTESGRLTVVNDHWSLAIMKEFPYVEQAGPWIVYNCSPEKTKLEFGNILSKYSLSLWIHNWDTWTVHCKNAKVAVVTSWETY
jgi:YD repeat-containing protein